MKIHKREREVIPGEVEIQFSQEELIEALVAYVKANSKDVPEDSLSGSYLLYSTSGGGKAVNPWQRYDGVFLCITET